MPINNITQTISTLPPAGRRGVDVQTQFVIKQEDFQDHLQGTTVTELNTLKDQLNSRIGEINSTTTTMNGYADTASAGASTATTKAGEASTSAGEALAYRNQAETFKNNASASATKASQWADNNYNVEVETGKYSAKHWSIVAQNTVNNKIDKVVTSTDNAIVRFDGVTGQVQNSGVIMDDNNNLSINTTSNSQKLSVKGDIGLIRDTSFHGEEVGATIKVTSPAVGYLDGSDLVFSTMAGDNTDGGTVSERMRIDALGNVGIGVTPSAWGSDHVGIIQAGVFLSVGSDFANGSQISRNCYYNGGWKRINNGKAHLHYMNQDGSYSWNMADSQVAGNAITWTNAMTLDASGDITVLHTYSNTTASAANMFVDSTGKFFRSTSSKQYKTDIETIDNSYIDTFFNNARPIYYKSLSNNDNPNWGYWGFIAEEIAEFDKRLVHWRYQTKEVEVEKERIIPAVEELKDEEGNIIQESKNESIEKYIEIETVNDESKPMIAEGVMYERITVLLTAKVQEQQKVIDSLISRIEILEGAK